jgi:predicted Zn-dependent peptidase
VSAVPLPLIAAGEAGTGQTLIGEAGGATVRRSVLPGGVRVLTEHMPGVRSATFGAWVGVGSRDEANGHHGSTHFLEHLLFKGTPRRTALDIASAFDAVGGEANAATGKEHTCYYARVLDDDLPMAVDVVVESEREVILEELAMNDDDPSDVAHERFCELVLGTHALGRPIGGTPDTIKACGRDDIVEHYRQHYVPAGLVVTAAGGVDHEAICAAVLERIRAGGWEVSRDSLPLPRRSTVRANIVGRRGEGVRVTPTPYGDRAQVVVNRPSEQAHLVLGTTGYVANDPRRTALSVLNTALGGGMSSRLFQEIRERRGLAYSVYSFSSGFADAGYFGLYAGCAPAKADQVISLLEAEFERIAAEPLDAEELARAKGQLSGGLVLGLEDSGSRMSRLGRAELVHGEYVDLDEALRRIRAVTAEDVHQIARDLVTRARSLTVVGPFEQDREFAV